MITINALASADSVIIPVQAQYLPAKGMTQLIKTINIAKKLLHPTERGRAIRIARGISIGDIISMTTNLQKPICTIEPPTSRHVWTNRSAKIGEFLKIGRRYTRMKTLTPSIVRELIDKIVIHHREKIDGVDVQKIEISYNSIGAIELPDLPK
jgi:hypothetical protein